MTRTSRAVKAPWRTFSFELIIEPITILAEEFPTAIECGDISFIAAGCIGAFFSESPLNPRSRAGQGTFLGAYT